MSGSVHSSVPGCVARTREPRNSIAAARRRSLQMLVVFGNEKEEIRFQYLPYVQHLSQAVSSLNAAWNVELLPLRNCSAQVVLCNIFGASMQPGDIFVWIGPFCRPVTLWQELQRKHPHVLRVWYNTEPGMRCPDMKCMRSGTCRYAGPGAVTWDIDEMWQYSHKPHHDCAVALLGEEGAEALWRSKGPAGASWPSVRRQNRTHLRTRLIPVSRVVPVGWVRSQPRPVQPSIEASQQPHPSISSTSTHANKHTKTSDVYQQITDGSHAGGHAMSDVPFDGDAQLLTLRFLGDIKYGSRRDCWAELSAALPPWARLQLTTNLTSWAEWDSQLAASAAAGEVFLNLHKSCRAPSEQQELEPRVAMLLSAVGGALILSQPVYAADAQIFRQEGLAEFAPIGKFISVAAALHNLSVSARVRLAAERAARFRQALHPVQTLRAAGIDELLAVRQRTFRGR